MRTKKRNKRKYGKSSKNAKRAVFLSCLGGIVILSCGFTGYKYYNPSIEIKESPLTIEYAEGTDYEGLVKANSNATSNQISWNSDNITVGNYEVVARLRGTEEAYKVKVADSTPPSVASNSDILEFDNGVASEDIILDSISVTDESDYTVKVVMPGDFSNTKAGKYTAEVIATDDYGNCTDTKVPFIVKEKKTSNPDNAIEIDDVDIYAYLNTGTSQEEVDEKGYDGTILTQLNMPGSGEPILVAGHNNREFEDLHNVEVGDDITLYYDGYEYNYEVIYSDICSTTGPDLTDKDTGENELEYSGRDVLQMYTCYKIYADNERWVVKAIRQ